MTLLSRSMVTRWAAGDGSLTSPSGAIITEAQALEDMPELGKYSLEVDGVPFEVERVGSRYCSVADIRSYAQRNNDSFADNKKYPDDLIMEKIQRAEETIEAACKRSFCRRAKTIVLEGAGFLEELPEQDVKSLSFGTLLGDRQAVSDSPGEARMVFGADCNAAIHDATITLTASYLRPRVGAENARGQSVDGVYISYELATGESGSWTGIPSVDAVIAANQSTRCYVV